MATTTRARGAVSEAARSPCRHLWTGSLSEENGSDGEQSRITDRPGPSGRGHPVRPTVGRWDDGTGYDVGLWCTRTWERLDLGPGHGAWLAGDARVLGRSHRWGRLVGPLDHR